MSRKSIILPKGRRARSGSPWIFSNEIRMDAAAKGIAAGSIVNVRGEDGRGFGTGYFNPKSLIAVDPSKGFIATARRNVSDQRVEFRIGDAESLPVESISQDAIASALALNFVPDRAPFLVLGLMTRVAMWQLTSLVLVAQCSPLA